MNYEDTLHNLKYEAHIHKNDYLATGDTNITEMCKDVIKTLEDCVPKDRIRKLLKEKAHITNSKETMTLDIYIKAKHEVDLLKQLLEEE